MRQYRSFSRLDILLLSTVVLYVIAYGSTWNAIALSVVSNSVVGNAVKSLPLYSFLYGPGTINSGDSNQFVAAFSLMSAVLFVACACSLYLGLTDSLDDGRSSLRINTASVSFLTISFLLWAAFLWAPGKLFVSNTDTVTDTVSILRLSDTKYLVIASLYWFIPTTVYTAVYATRKSRASHSKKQWNG